MVGVTRKNPPTRGDPEHVTASGREALCDGQDTRRQCSPAGTRVARLLVRLFEAGQMTKPFESRPDHSRAPLRASPVEGSAREECGAGKFRRGGGTSCDIALSAGEIGIARQTADPHSCGLQTEGVPTNSAKPPSGRVVGNAFSKREFVEICAKGFGDRYRAAEISVIGSGPDRAFYALECPEPMGLRSFALAPCSLYASPGWEGTLQLSTLRGIFDQLVGSRIRKFNWKVFFDHQELTAGLSRLRLVSRQESTHLVRLDRD